MSASAHCWHINAGNTEMPMTPWEDETKVPCFTFPLTLPYMPFPGQFFICIFKKAAIPWIYTKRKSYFVKIHTPQCSLLYQGFPGGSDGKELACSAGDLGSIPGLGRSPGGGDGNPLQSSCLLLSMGTTPMDRGAWQTTIHGVAKSQAQLSD